MMFYLFARLRTKAVMRPYLRATCNPEPGWLAELLAPYIGDDGFPDPAMRDAMTHFERVGDRIARLPEPTQDSISLQFVPGKLSDNPYADPEYDRKLKALSPSSSA